MPSVTAEFSWAPLTPAVGQVVTFTDESSAVDCTLDNTFRLWWFQEPYIDPDSGDVNPTHAYSAPGTYAVAMRAFDETSVFDDQVIHYVTVPPPPITVFPPASGTPPSVPLFVHGHLPASTGVPLAIGGAGGGESGVPLFVEGFGGPGSGATPLFVEGAGAADSGIPLFTFANNGSGLVPLYTLSSVEASGGIPLHADGVYGGTAGMSLVVKVDPVPRASGGVPLLLAGTATGSGVWAGVGNGGEPHSGGMALFVSAPDSGQHASNVNLWVDGAAHQAAGGIDLFVDNQQSGVVLGAPLYASGQGAAAGYLPDDADMPLVLIRDPAAGLTLFTAGPGTPSGVGLALSLLGSVGSTKDVPLSVTGLGHAARGQRLYTHGW